MNVSSISCTNNAQGLLNEAENARGQKINYTYVYDKRGNITEKTGEGQGDLSRIGSATMTYDADNRLVTYNGEEITYDADGNMLHGPLDGGMADFTYDCRNRLIQVVSEGGDVTRYEYDAENTRLSSETENEKRIFVTDKGATYSQLLEEHIYEKNLLGIYKETGAKTYTYGTGLLSERRSGSAKEDSDGESNDAESYYYHYNYIGSTTEFMVPGTLTRDIQTGS